MDSLKKLMHDRLQKIKDREKGFKSTRWNDYRYGNLHISEVEIKSIPTDALLFDFYNEVVKWHLTKPL